MNEYINLLECFPNSTKIIALPFWPDKNKINIITDVALKTGSFLVDISHLGNGTDKDNFAFSQKKYKNPAVGLHPGDYGMNNIAKCFYSVMSPLLDRKVVEQNEER